MPVFAFLERLLGPRRLTRSKHLLTKHDHSHSSSTQLAGASQAGLINKQKSSELQEIGNVGNTKSKRIGVKSHSGPQEGPEISAAVSQADFLTEGYEYQPLTSASSFRVLELLPENKGKEISFHLRVANFDNPPEYEAISYCWGNPSVKVPARCEGKLLQITPSLWDALVQMRFPDKSRTLWADAVCINQEDYDERNQQVQNMLQIYQHSNRVLVWLGPCRDNKAELAAAAVHEMVKVTCDQRQISLSALRNTENLHGIVLDSLSDYNGLKWEQRRFRESLQWLLSRPWFTRVWVFQEINAVTESLVLCGDIKIDWDVLSLSISILNAIQTPGRKIWDGFDQRPFLYQARFLRSRHHLKPNYSSLMSLMARVRMLEATDPRDRIYGLLGLPPMTILDSIKVDYKKSKLEIYLEFAGLMLSRMPYLDTLLLVEHDDKDKIPEDFPSWVPQWDRNIPHAFDKVMLEFKASGDIIPAIKRDEGSSILIVSGIIVDTITEEFRGIKGLTQLLGSAETFPGEPDFHDAISETLVRGADPFGRISNYQQHIQDYFAFYAKSRGIDMEEIMLFMEWGCLAQRGSTSRFETLVNKAFQGSELFGTKQRRFGIGTRALRVGDIICVLFGGRVPFILRPKDGYYQLVGEAFIYGIMDGKVIEDWKAGKVKEQQFEIH